MAMFTTKTTAALVAIAFASSLIVTSGGIMGLHLPQQRKKVKSQTTV
jgi:hypothetical protein